MTSAESNECELCDKLVGESCVCLDCYNLQAGAWEESQKQLASVATQMRDKCIEKVEELRDDYREADLLQKAAAATEVLEALGLVRITALEDQS